MEEIANYEYVENMTEMSAEEQVGATQTERKTESLMDVLREAFTNVLETEMTDEEKVGITTPKEIML